VSAIKKIGGLGFSPGEAWSLTYPFDPAIDPTATVKLRIDALTISGAVAPSGSSVGFTLTAEQTGTLAQFNLYDAQIQVNDEATPVVFETGESFLGFSNNPLPAGSVISLSAGAGIAVSPNPITSTGTISATGTIAATLGGMTNVAAAVDTATNNQLLQYSTSDSAWTAVNHASVPAPGAAVVMPYQAYSPAQSALAEVKRRSYYHAPGGTGGGAEDLIASGVEFVVQYGGYWIQNSNSLKQGLDSQWIEVTSAGALSYNRTAHPGAAADGFYIWVDYVETT